MRKRYLTLFVVLMMLLPEAQAQYDPSFSHYWAMETSFNPAAAGKDPKLNVNGAYNMTLTGFEHYPKTMYINADMPFYFIRSYHGVGVQVVNDVIGLFSHKKVNLQYAYKLRLFGGTLGIGLQVVDLFTFFCSLVSLHSRQALLSLHPFFNVYHNTGTHTKEDSLTSSSDI